MERNLIYMYNTGHIYINYGMDNLQKEFFMPHRVEVSRHCLGSSFLSSDLYSNIRVTGSSFVFAYKALGTNH